MTQIEKAVFVLQQGFSNFLPGTFFTSLKISAVHRVWHWLTAGPSPGFRSRGAKNHEGRPHF